MADPPRPSWQPPPVVVKVTAWSACLLVVAAASWLVLQVLSVLALVVFPLVVTAFLTRVLAPPSQWLRARGWRPVPAAAASVVGFLVLIVASGAAIAPAMVSEFQDLGDAVSDAVGEVEDWVVEDSGLDISRADIRSAREDLGDRAGDLLRSNSDQILSGARLVLTGVAGLALALLLTFFALKDGPEVVARAHQRVPVHRRRQVEVVAGAAWAALGGYLRGAALLGALEAVIIGGTLAVLGVGLVLPVMLVTFLAAFVPLVGAVAAGILAVLVALAAGGITDAIIVGVVALVVQQLDNDLLAPWIYGRSLNMHPVIILLAIATGTAAFGLVGTFLAVPVTAVVLSSVRALRNEQEVGPSPDGDDPTGLLGDAASPGP